MKFRFDRTTTDTAKAVFVGKNPENLRGYSLPEKNNKRNNMAKFGFKTDKTDTIEKLS